MKLWKSTIKIELYVTTVEASGADVRRASLNAVREAFDVACASVGADAVVNFSEVTCAEDVAPEWLSAAPFCDELDPRVRLQANRPIHQLIKEGCDT